MKTVALILTLALGFTALMIPVHATTYGVTFTLKEDGEAFWTATISVEASNNKTILVPIGFYDMITLWFESDTFETNFILQLPINNSTLEVTSDPQGLTIIFQPMLPGDVNGDGTVNIYDLVLVAKVYGKRSLFCDLYFDGAFRINIYDLVAIARNYGRKY